MTEGDARSRRVLLLAPFPPRLDGRHGGSRAVAQLVTALTRRHRVALAYLRASDEPPADPDVAAVCARVVEGRRPGISASAVRPPARALAVLPGLAAGRPLWVAARWNAAFARLVRTLAESWHPDVLQAEFTAMVPYLEAIASRAPRVVTVHEPGVPPARHRAAASRGLARAFWRTDARRWERFERDALRRVDAAVVFSDGDRAELEQLGASISVRRIPLAAAIPDAPLDPLGTDPPELLFVGNFVHPPNLDAALHLAADLFPRVRIRVPGVRLALVGADPPERLRALVRDDILVPGWVPDLTPYLDRAALVVAPLRLGGGMRVKVAESLGSGKAVVGSALAFAGIPVQSGVDALVAATDEAFVDGAVALLRDPSRRVAMATAARAMAILQLGPARTADAYAALYASLARGTGT